MRWLMNSKGMDNKHCKWPLSTVVFVNTPDGYIKGRVSRHVKGYPYACDICFDVVVDMGDANGRRYSHIIPFRNIKPVGKVRLLKPWYKEDKYRGVK
jgi:hypothetical protein